MIAIGIINVPIFTRLLRGSILPQKESDYVLAARSVGVRNRSILFGHIMPNAISPVIVAGTLALATAIIDAAGLGFLGLGPQDPATPEWGTMLTGTVAVPPDGSVPRHLPGRRDRHRRARLQPDRRRAARGARPEAAGTDLVASRPPLLEVEDLHVHFATERGVVHAVNGISFSVATGETLGLVGESGCGKSVTALALMGILPRNGRVVQRQRARRRTGADRALRTGAAADPRRRDRDHLPGPDDQPESGAHDREAARRGDLAHLGPRRQGSRATRDRPARPGRHPEREGPADATTPISSRAGCASAR